MTEFREGDRVQLTGEEVTVEDPITVHNAHNYEQDAGAYQPDMSGRTADPQDVGRESAPAQDDTSGAAPVYDECGCRVFANAEDAVAWLHADDPELPQTDLCECGHGRDGHYSGRYGCVVGPIGDLCPCAAYRPTPSTEETQ